MKVILYSSETCPKCNILKKKLDSKKIKYEVFCDVEKMILDGITNIPILSIDGEKLDFKQATKWIGEK